MTTRRTKIVAIATAALLAIGLPLAAQSDAPAGVIVTGVDPDGPAAAAGIERGDLILSFDGQDLDDARDLMQALADADGSEVTLSVQHGDDMRDQVVTIDRVWGQPRIGLTITGGMGTSMDLMPMDAFRHGYRFHVESDEPGVVVMQVAADSAAEASGLQPGDWITAVGGQALDGDAGQLMEIIGDHAPGDEVSIAYERDGEEMTATVTLGENPESGAAMLGISYRAMPTMEALRGMMDEMRERFGRRGMRRWGGRAGGDKDKGSDMHMDMDAASAL